MASVESELLDVTIIRGEGALGLEIFDDGDGHAAVNSIAEGTPAADTKMLMPGDVIVAVNGNACATIAKVTEEINRLSAARQDGTVRLSVRRRRAMLVPTVWSAGAVVIAAGSMLSVPLVVREQSKGEYGLSCVDGGTVAFSVTTDDGATELVPRYLTEADSGDFPIRSPCTVVALLDNSAGWSAVTVACRVVATPLAQLAEVEAAEVRAELRAQQGHVRSLGVQQAELQHREAELAAQLASVRQSIAAVAGIRATDAARADALDEYLVALDAVAESSRDDGIGTAFDMASEAIARSAATRQAASSERSDVRRRIAEAEVGQGREARRAAIAAAATNRAANLMPLLPLSEVLLDKPCPPPCPPRLCCPSRVPSHLPFRPSSRLQCCPPMLPLFGRCAPPSRRCYARRAPRRGSAWSCMRRPRSTRSSSLGGRACLSCRSLARPAPPRAPPASARSHPPASQRLASCHPRVLISA